MTTETLGLFVRLVFSLAVVIGIMWMAANVVKKRGLVPAARRGGARGVQVELLARRGLSRNASIAVVRVGDRSMVVGVTDHNITKLDDLEMEAIDLNPSGNTWTVPLPGLPSGNADGNGNGNGHSSVTPGSPWKTMLDQLRDKTARR